MSRKTLVSAFLLAVLICAFTPWRSHALTKSNSAQISDLSIVAGPFISTSQWEALTDRNSQLFSPINRMLPSSPPDLQSIIDQITTTTYYAKLNHLAGTIGPRPWGSTGNDQAVEFIADEFQSYGLQVDTRQR